jgi:hypothetical protein
VTGSQVANWLHADGAATDNVRVTTIERKHQRMVGTTWVDQSLFYPVAPIDGAADEPSEAFTIDTGSLGLPAGTLLRWVVRVTDASNNQNTCTSNAVSFAPPPGYASQLGTSWDRNPVAADGSSTATLTVSLQDPTGATLNLNGTYLISAMRRATSADYCRITAVPLGTAPTFSGEIANAFVVNGSVAFTFTSTTTPGICTVDVVVNATWIPPTVATLTTQTAVP